jgi:hypothetical protein
MYNKIINFFKGINKSSHRLLIYSLFTIIFIMSFIMYIQRIRVKSLQNEIEVIVKGRVYMFPYYVIPPPAGSIFLWDTLSKLKP